MPAAYALAAISAVALTLAAASRTAVQLAPVAADLTADDVLQRTRALYPTLRSYADTGTVTEESQGFVTRSRFRTYYANTPRNFFFDYRQIASDYQSGQRIVLDGRIVIWMLRGHLQSWNSVLGSHDEYPEGATQLTPFVQAAAATTGAALLIPSLIYVKANFRTTLQELSDVTGAGTEVLRGRRCSWWSSWGSR